MKQLRLLSYNVRNCRGLDIPAQQDVARIARVIKEQAPDLVALQELDRGTERSSGRDILAELAELTGLEGVYAPAINYNGGEYGHGLLTRWCPRRHYKIPLPGREEVRALLVSEFDDFVFFSTHLSLTPESQIEAVHLINRELGLFKKPAFMAGDFNAEPESVTLRLVEQRWSRLSPLQFTFPADLPDRVIDYIFAVKGAGVEVLEAAVIEEPAASDHRPVFVKVGFNL